MLLAASRDAAQGGNEGSMQRIILAGVCVLVAALSAPVLAGEDCRRALARPQQPPVAIAFAADSAELAAGERERLRRLVPQLLQAPNLKLCVIAQADGQGDDAYNRSLAERRAQAVSRALADAGLPSHVITVEVGAAEGPSYHALERRILLLEARR